MEHSRIVSLLSSSINVSELKQLHALIIKQGSALAHPFLTYLIADPSTISYARKVYDAIPQPDPSIFNYVITTYSKQSFHREVLEIFFAAQKQGTGFTFYSIPPVLKASAALAAIGEGKQVHSLILVRGFLSNVYVQTGLIDFYSKAGDLDSARSVFVGIAVKDPVPCNCLITGYSKLGRVLEARYLFDEMPIKTAASWNTMIACYANCGNQSEALRLFEQMQTEKIQPSEITLATVLSVCAKLGDLRAGLDIKKLIDYYGLCKNMIVRTALLEMYAKCGAIDEGRSVFDQIQDKDVVSWSTMITGYAQNGRPNEALELFEKMKLEGCKPNEVTFVGALSACSQLGSVDVGQQIGKYVESHGNISSVYVASALLNMYARCGNLRRAHQIFDQMQQKDIVSWNSMIRGLATNGRATDAIDLYYRMMHENVQPNDITFVGLLTACSHTGLVDLGLKFFDSMEPEHKIVPKVEHCSCIVDLLCRSGKLYDAYEFICKMEVERNVAIWGTLLSSCRVHSNVELAEYAVERLLILEPDNSSNYILLSNIYADTGKWEEARRLRNLMRSKNVQKLAGYSWIELERTVHKFLVHDAYHPRSNEIYNVVDQLASQLKLAYYIPETDIDLLQCMH